MIEQNEKPEKIEDIKDDEIMTVREVATYFKVSEATALKQVVDGELPAFKIGSHWRIKKSELSKHIETLKLGKGNKIT
ncbi:helix-turn-helix domain-containing protein [Clostridium lacusfryxellense]|uniref:helix-turn-helix domain-containing protein n=1 Tax=Clostridium lacusfryxellense TaxID=205328 RepID=UPI001C0BA6A3|nr:helix-turn-helix domain-containing protein [Clostridium lacusfryxellense]MBU3114797.1 helix-turn-helix domain-containing protein [Clostridium lacusfryxellense]